MPHLTKFEREKYRNNSLQYYIDKLKITQWDYIILGDGSGTTRDKPCGWASVVIDKKNRRREYSGRYNFGGSNIVAETMAYVQPVSDIVKQELKLKKARRIHIITDCQYVAEAGNNIEMRRKNPCLWAPFEAAQRHGFFVIWHWWRRDEIRLNQLAHELANAQRKVLNDADELEIALRNTLPENRAQQSAISLKNCTKFRPGTSATEPIP